MKLSSMVRASLVALAALTFAVDGAFAGVNYNSSKSNTGAVTNQPATACPNGQTWDTTTKKCVMPSSINYNASKSNTGNVTAPAGTPGNGPPKCSPSDQRSRDKANRAKCANNL
jgi:hypothetical protein